MNEDLVIEDLLRTNDVPDRTTREGPRTIRTVHGHQGHFRPTAAAAIGAGLYAAKRINDKINEYNTPRVASREQANLINEGIFTTGGRKAKTTSNTGFPSGVTHIHEYPGQKAHVRPLVAAAAGAYAAKKAFDAKNAYDNYKASKHDPNAINESYYDECLDDFMMEAISIEEMVNESTPPMEHTEKYYRDIRSSFDKGRKYGFKRGGLIGAGAGLAAGALGAAAVNHFNNKKKESNQNDETQPGHRTQIYLNKKGW